MTIITEKVTNAGITMAKDMSVDTIMAMKAAAVITVSKPLCEDHIRSELTSITESRESIVLSRLNPYLVDYSAVASLKASYSA